MAPRHPLARICHGALTTHPCHGTWHSATALGNFVSANVLPYKHITVINSCYTRQEAIRAGHSGANRAGLSGHASQAGPWTGTLAKKKKSSLGGGKDLWDTGGFICGRCLTTRRMPGTAYTASAAHAIFSLASHYAMPPSCPTTTSFDSMYLASLNCCTTLPRHFSGVACQAYPYPHCSFYLTPDARTYCPSLHLWAEELLPATSVPPTWHIARRAHMTPCLGRSFSPRSPKGVQHAGMGLGDTFKHGSVPPVTEEGTSSTRLPPLPQQCGFFAKANGKNLACL